MRKLQYHEKKLLKKVDLVGFNSEENIRVIEIMRKYNVTKREDYTKCVDTECMHLLFLFLIDFLQVQQACWSRYDALANTGLH